MILVTLTHMLYTECLKNCCRHSNVDAKLPSFWPADPEVWFVQVQTQFTTKDVTMQKTRFDCHQFP